MNPSAIPGYPSILLRERTRPADIAILIETEEEALDTVCINIPGFRIASEACPADSVEGDRGMKNVELIIPDELAGFGIEAGDAFLFGDVFANASDDIDPAIENNRCRTPYKFCLPEQVLPFS